MSRQDNDGLPLSYRNVFPRSFEDNLPHFDKGEDDLPHTHNNIIKRE